VKLCLLGSGKLLLKANNFLREVVLCCTDVLPVPKEDFHRALPVARKHLSSFLFFLCKMRLCRSQPRGSLPANPAASKLTPTDACPQRNPQGVGLYLFKRFYNSGVLELAKLGEGYGDVSLCSPGPKRRSATPSYDSPAPGLEVA